MIVIMALKASPRPPAMHYPTRRPLTLAVWEAPFLNPLTVFLGSILRFTASHLVVGKVRVRCVQASPNPNRFFLK
jgi:hypothetical protein